MKICEKILFTGGKVVTMDAGQSVCSGVLVSNGRIEAVGEGDELRAIAGGKTRHVNLRGRVLYPGLIDTHSHLPMYAAWKHYAYCGSADSLQTVLDRLAGQGRMHPEEEIVVGYGFDDTDIPEQRGPDKAELDAICPDRPLLLLHISVHAAYANSPMLRRLGIDPGMPSSDPDVECKNGMPTGRITEHVAFRAMELMPSPSLESFREMLCEAVRDYNAQGFTTTIGGGSGLGGISPFMEARTLLSLEKEKKLNLRVYLSCIWPEYEKVAAAGMMDGIGTPMVRPGGVKLFADGSIQAFTAAIPEGYHNRPEHRPSIIGSQAELDEAVYRVHAAGRQVLVHGNGNGAIEAIIAAVEKAQGREPRPDPRHLLIHCQMASDGQLRRMKKAGLWPSFFGLHVWNWGDRHRDIFLGPERAARIDPCGSAVQLDLPFSLHADTPVLPQMTMLSIHTAVNRMTKSGRELGPEQRVSALEAMRAYTSYAAAMCFGEASLGSIEPGKEADFTLFGDDPCAVPSSQIRNIPILATFCGGRLVWGSVD